MTFNYNLSLQKCYQHQMDNSYVNNFIMQNCHTKEAPEWTLIFRLWTCIYTRDLNLVHRWRLKIFLIYQRCITLRARKLKKHFIMYSSKELSILTETSFIMVSNWGHGARHSVQFPGIISSLWVTPYVLLRRDRIPFHVSTTHFLQ